MRDKKHTLKYIWESFEDKGACTKALKTRMQITYILETSEPDVFYLTSPEKLRIIFYGEKGYT